MIQIIVTERSISATPTTPVTSGSVGLPVKWTFSEEWDELVKTAVFRGSGEARDVALLSDECAVPADVLTESGGALEIGVYGRLADGTLVMPTIWARIDYIRDGALPSEVSPSDPEPDWTAQVQAAAAQAVATANEAKEVAITSQESAAASAEAAEAAATGAGESAEDSEAWAVGKRGGVDVLPTDPAYHNNAKYWADEAHTYPPLDYNRLANRPQINGVTLDGNKSFEDLGEMTITNVELQSIINDQYNLVFGGG